MKFIQVGVGGFGNRWVDVLKNSEQAEVVGMVDISDDALQKACEKGGYEQSICFKSLTDAMAKVDAEAVVVCTPPEYHLPPVCEALEAGLDVISEKPMADSIENCKTMLRTAKETGNRYVVSQNYRYNAPTWTLGQMVKDGKIGEIGQVKVDFFLGKDFHGGFRHEMDFPLIVDMSIHHFDLMRFITGLNPITVQGMAWNPKWSNYKGDCSSIVLFEMDNGARIAYNASWCCKGQFNGWNGDWQVEGDKGCLKYENDVIRFLDVPELYNVENDVEVEPQNPPLPGQDYVLDEFIRTAGTDERPATDVFDNINSIAMVFAAVEAVKTGKPVPVLDDEIKDLLA